MVPVAAAVAHLVAVATDGEGGAVGQIGEGARDRCCRSVADRGENCAGSHPLVRNWREVKLCAGLDGDAIGNHLVCPGPLGVELAGVAAVRFEGEQALDGQGGRPVRVDARLQESACAAPGAHSHLPPIIPLPPSMPASTATAPGPVPEPVVLSTFKPPSIMTVPAR